MSDFVGTFVGAFTVGRFGKNWFLPIIMLVVLAITESVYVVKISRHMRVGELCVASPAQVFGLFPTMLMYVAVTYLCAQLLSFVPVGVVLLLRSVSNVVVAGVLSLVVTFPTCLPHLYARSRSSTATTIRSTWLCPARLATSTRIPSLYGDSCFCTPCCA